MRNRVVTPCVLRAAFWRCRQFVFNAVCSLIGAVCDRSLSGPKRSTRSGKGSTRGATSTTPSGIKTALRSSCSTPRRRLCRRVIRRAHNLILPSGGVLVLGLHVLLFRTRVRAFQRQCAHPTQLIPPQAQQQQLKAETKLAQQAQQQAAKAQRGAMQVPLPAPK